MTPPASVYLWGSLIGAVSYPRADAPESVFEFNPAFLNSGIEVAPLQMPLRSGTYRFPDISRRTFKGLPGMLADSLPDKFGNQLIDQYMAGKGLAPERVTAIDRLLYVGTRGMGALEYQPTQTMDNLGAESGGFLDLQELTDLVNWVFSRHEDLAQKLDRAETKQTAFDLLRVGTSAGGARAKALIALDPSGRAKAGHWDHGVDHTYWLMKFDGIEKNSDQDREDPPGMTVVEYVYSLMAGHCGIQLPRCRLLEDGDQRHFLIERFDRMARNGKLDKVHYTSWSGMDHAHRDNTQAFSYEQLILVMRRLGLPQSDVTQLFRRAVFNVVGRNQDDHTKNVGFLMNRKGQWSLAPAFDLTYAYDPQGLWTKTHQITLNGKGDGFVREDLVSFGRTCNLTTREATPIINTTVAAFGEFSTLAVEYHIPEPLAKTIQSQLRLHI